MLFVLAVGFVDAGFRFSSWWRESARRWRGLSWVAEVDVEIVVAGDVARLFGSLDFGLKFLDHVVLDHLATRRVDWMGDVGVQLGATIGVSRHPIGGERRAALIAVLGAKVVFRSAARAMASELAARHRDEGAVGPFDNFEIAHDKTVVKGNRAKRLEPFARFFHKFDSHLGNFHDTFFPAGIRPFGTETCCR